MPLSDGFPERFRDDESSDSESPPLRSYTADASETPTWLPKWYKSGRWKSDDTTMKTTQFRFRPLDGSSLSKRRRRMARIRIMLVVLAVLTVFGSIVGV
jgi:hypothetical protein